MKRQRARKKLKAASRRRKRRPAAVDYESGAVDRRLFPDFPGREEKIYLFRDRPGRKEKIYPRNLTALAAYVVAGNPAVTRPEDAVANCFPGLEMDVRNLDRRFFPGLVFEFVEDGARLAYVDALSDPDLQFNNPHTQRFYQAYKIDEETAKKLFDRITDGSLDEGKWYLDWIEQSKNNKKYQISVRAPPDQVEDGNAQSIAWRLVRS